MNNEAIKHLTAFVTAVTRGDYPRSNDDIKRLSESVTFQKDEAEFVESLELMSIKLVLPDSVVVNTGL